MSTVKTNHRKTTPPPLPAAYARKKSHRGLWLALWMIVTVAGTGFMVHWLLRQAGYSISLSDASGKANPKAPKRHPVIAPRPGNKQQPPPQNQLVLVKRPVKLTVRELIASYKPDKFGNRKSPYTGQRVTVSGCVWKHAFFKNGEKPFAILQNPANLLIQPGKKPPAKEGVSCRKFLDDGQAFQEIEAGTCVTITGICTGLVKHGDTPNDYEIGNVGLQDGRVTKIWTSDEALAAIVAQAVKVTAKQLHAESRNELTFKQKYGRQLVRITGTIEDFSRSMELKSPDDIKIIAYLSRRYNPREVRTRTTKYNGFKVELVGLPSLVSGSKSVWMRSAVLLTPISELDRLAAARAAGEEIRQLAELKAIEKQLRNGPVEVLKGSLPTLGKALRDKGHRQVECTGRVALVKQTNNQEFPFVVLIKDQSGKITVECAFGAKYKTTLKKLKAGDAITVRGRAQGRKIGDKFYLANYSSSLFLRHCVLIK